MPLPTPTKTEKKSGFISRCMANDTMQREFPDQQQRAAVCHQQWKKHRSSEGDKK